MTGAWAERALRALTVPGAEPRAAAILAHLGALAAAAAARAGLRFTADVPVRDGLLTLPTLGACTVAAGPGTVTVTGDGRRLWLHTPPSAGAPARRRVEVRRGPDGVWRSAAAGWRPIRALLGRRRPARADRRRRPVPRRGTQSSDPYGLTVSGALGAVEHARWRTAWRDALPWLQLGGGARRKGRCAPRLLRAAHRLGTARCSGTRGDAFGALLSSTPLTGWTWPPPWSTNSSTPDSSHCPR